VFGPDQIAKLHILFPICKKPCNVSSGQTNQIISLLDLFCSLKIHHQLQNVFAGAIIAIEVANKPRCGPCLPSKPENMGMVTLFCQLKDTGKILQISVTGSAFVVSAVLVRARSPGVGYLPQPREMEDQ
jgi:hypothetical protein